MHLHLNDYRNPTKKHFIKCLVTCQNSQFICTRDTSLRLFVHRLEHNKELSRSQCSLILDLLLKSAMKERSCDDIFMAACNLQDLQCLIMIMIRNL
ncbi:hypothetical protein QL285_042178 [Trifolium repens]|nr:hypothetical protein QL285_042178 [Trifolium repens]